MTGLIKNSSFWALATILYFTSQTIAYESQVFDTNKNYCEEMTKNIEKKFGIPQNLLSAISLVETGRWDKSRNASFTWPWTVTSGGKGHFFNSKAEAIEEISYLISKGVKNIDVGCMQVNLFYHGSAFKSISEALDPETNVTYAANYLRKLFSKNNNWIKAASDYHSTTPKLNKAYKARLLAHWPGKNHKVEKKQIVTFTPSTIDYQRMAKLNLRFRARIERQNQIKTLKSNTTQQLKAWRDAQIKGIGMDFFLAKRRAIQRLQKKRELAQLSKTKSKKLYHQNLKKINLTLH